VYGLNTALDQIGATIGPLLIALVLVLKGNYRTGYGAGWLVGSVTTGLLYERSHPLLVAFSVVVQLVSLPVFLLARSTSR
jgi:hypothetical protein